jgi:glycosyltransferase involved in cell wall biosynthesis
MEAMAMAKPVVASSVRGNRDLVDCGHTGYLVELGDVSGLAAALERLIIDGSLRAEMGQAGSRKIADYSLECVVGEMSAIYRKYLSEEPSSVGGHVDKMPEQLPQ